MLRFSLAVALCCALQAADHPLKDEIATGFATWSPQTQPRTPLYYAEHLAVQSDPTSKSWAQAIILHGAGFGGFSRRNAIGDEMGQYFNVIYYLRASLSNAKSADTPPTGSSFSATHGSPDPSNSALIEIPLKGMIDGEATGRSANITYHQNIVLFLSKYAAGFIQDVQGIQKISFGVKDAFYWLGRYGLHHNTHLRGMGEELAAFRLFQTKSACVYSGYFDAAPHVHPYGTEENESTSPHYSWMKASNGQKIFLVMSEPLGSWQGKPLLLRPHAYVGHQAGVGKGGGWAHDVQASVTWSDGTPGHISGSVHIHDNVASPAGVMVLGDYAQVMTKGPFVTHITSHFPAKTLHVLLPSSQQGLLLSNLGTVELVGYLSLVYPNPAHQAFIVSQLANE